MIYGDYKNIAFEENILEEISDLLEIKNIPLVSYFDEALVYPYKKIVHYYKALTFIPILRKEDTEFGAEEVLAYVDIYEKKDWTNGKTGLKNRIRIEFDCHLLFLKYESNGINNSKIIPCFNKILWEHSYIQFPGNVSIKIPLDWKKDVTPDNIFEINEEIKALFEINFG